MAPDRGETAVVICTTPTDSQQALSQTFEPEHSISEAADIAADSDSLVEAAAEHLSTSISDLKLSSTSPSPDHPSAPTLQSPSHTPPHLSHDPTVNKKRTDPFQFGQRYLTSTDDVFTYNAWDHVTPDSTYTLYAESQYEFQRSNPVSDYDKSRINSAPTKWWDTFYRHKSSTFFKDRKWLTQEFPILREVTQANAGRKRILEVGAGAGNTAFPILRMNENPELEVFAYDFSKMAVATMRESEEFLDRQPSSSLAAGDVGDVEKGAEKLGSLRCEVWDLASSHPEPEDNLPPDIAPSSVDVLVLIFTFSALAPSQWEQAVSNIWNVLKPGGLVLFRDYGRGDLAQVRFKSGRWMEENFYIRGDGTRVYFFEEEQIRNIFGGRSREAGNQGQEDQHTRTHEQDTKNGEQSPRFEILDLDIDRRLIVNRQRRIKMYRCWLQGRFRKQFPTIAAEGDK